MTRKYDPRCSVPNHRFKKNESVESTNDSFIGISRNSVEDSSVLLSRKNEGHTNFTNTYDP